MVAALLSSGAAAQIDLPSGVGDGGAITVAEVRANSRVLFDRFAGPEGGPIARDRFVGLELPSDLGPGQPGAPALGTLFDLLDADGDGSLTRGEWNEQIDRQLGFADENGDGRVTLDELAKARENLDLGDALGIIF